MRCVGHVMTLMYGDRTARTLCGIRAWMYGKWALGRFSNSVDVDTINCHGHSYASFRLRVDHVFATRPGCLTRRDVDVPVHVFLTLNFEFSHTSVRLHASCACAVTATRC